MSGTNISYGQAGIGLLVDVNVILNLHVRRQEDTTLYW